MEHRLAPHSRDAHRNFFFIPSLFKIKILTLRHEFETLGHKGLKEPSAKISTFFIIDPSVWNLAWSYKIQFRNFLSLWKFPISGWKKILDFPNLSPSYLKLESSVFLFKSTCLQTPVPKFLIWSWFLCKVWKFIMLYYSQNLGKNHT